MKFQIEMKFIGVATAVCTINLKFLIPVKQQVRKVSRLNTDKTP